MKSTMLRDLAITFLFVTVSTIIGILFRMGGLQTINVVVVYILAVILTARLTKGYFWGLAAAIMDLLTFNWFFTEPYYTLKVNDPTYLITFFIMTTTAFITSALTTTAKQAEADAREKEAESKAMYQTTNLLTDAKDVDAIAQVTVQAVSELLSCYAACVCFDETGEPEPTFWQKKADGTIIKREVENPAELKKRMNALHSPCDEEEEFCDWPIYGRTMLLAVLRLPPDTGETMSPTQRRVLLAVIESTALAMERIRSMEMQTRDREQMEQERYRGNLLRAISHDLRTPLAGIMGAGEMIMQMTDKDEQPYALAKNIYEDADWLRSLVENILNLTKLQDGKIQLEKQPEAVEEVIGAAIAAMEKRYPDREINVEMPDRLLLVPMDARLIHQVLINLMDNAFKHSPEGSEVTVTVNEDEDEQQVIFSVSDHGSGISPRDMKRVFEMFYTTRGNAQQDKRGIGLGLSICKTIIAAHGGTITAGNRETGTGAVFSFTLPTNGEENANDEAR